MKIRFLFLISCALFLSACANKPHPRSIALSNHEANLASINQWQLSGKLGIKTPEESGSLSLRWHQQSDSYEISLTSPLGQKSFLISGDLSQVTFKEKGKPSITGRSPEALLKKTTGWNLPLTELNYWIRGLPAPKGNVKQITPNAIGLIEQLEQSDWVIDYPFYHSIQNQDQLIYLPKKIVIQHKDFRLTLVIREWKL
jgi:outer membrane lipoprotein LolB